MSQTVSVGALPPPAAPPAAGASAAAEMRNKKTDGESVERVAKVYKVSKEKQLEIQNLIPTALIYCQVGIPFGNEEEQEWALHKIAERISILYSAFFTQQYHHTRPKNLCFEPKRPPAFPPSAQVKAFQQHLKDLIDRKIRQGKGAVELCTTEDLSVTAVKSGIGFPLSPFFPKHALILIKADTTRKEFKLAMIF